MLGESYFYCTRGGGLEEGYELGGCHEKGHAKNPLPASGHFRASCKPKFHSRPWPVATQRRCAFFHQVTDTSYTPPGTGRFCMFLELNMAFRAEELKIMAYRSQSSSWEERYECEGVRRRRPTCKCCSSTQVPLTQTLVPPPMVAFILIASPNTQPRSVVSLRRCRCASLLQGLSYNPGSCRFCTCLGLDRRSERRL